MPRFGCPKCKSASVSEINVVEVLVPVTEWNDGGEPEGFGTWSTIDGTITDKQSYALRFEDTPRYHCDACDEEFNTPAKLEDASVAS